MVTSDVDTALRRMDKHDLDMRNKRLKRAADLSLKHTYLPYEMQEQHDPWADSRAHPLPSRCFFRRLQHVVISILDGWRACVQLRPSWQELRRSG